MIAPDMRRAALRTFPLGTPLTVLALPLAGFAAFLRERDDDVPVLRDLAAVALDTERLDPATPHLLVEGLDALAEPEAFLRAVRERAPQARVFALISNAAHLGSLGAFYAGAPIAAAHPLVPEEIEPLFAAGGWQILAIKNLIDESIPPATALPFAVTARTITFNLIEPAMLERCRNAGFLVIADPR